MELFKRLQAEIGFACLFITHDLAVVDMLADRIMVMHKGQIVEHGTHAELLEAKGAYYRLYESQYAMIRVASGAPEE